MSTLIDTTAIVAFLDNSDPKHTAAYDTWYQLLMSEEELVAASYCVVETTAVLQRKAGRLPIEEFTKKVLPALRIVWINETMHTAAMSEYLADGGGRHALSLVDCVNLELVRCKRADKLFAYDRHFSERGITLVGQ